MYLLYNYEAPDEVKVKYDDVIKQLEVARDKDLSKDGGQAAPKPEPAFKMEGFWMSAALKIDLKLLLRAIGGIDKIIQGHARKRLLDSLGFGLSVSTQERFADKKRPWRKKLVAIQNPETGKRWHHYRYH